MLKDGAELVTLGDAAQLIAEEFKSVTRNAVLGHAIALLVQAAETGRAADRRKATDQVETLMRMMGWL